MGASVRRAAAVAEAIYEPAPRATVSVASVFIACFAASETGRAPAKRKAETIARAKRRRVEADESVTRLTARSASCEIEGTGSQTGLRAVAPVAAEVPP